MFGNIGPWQLLIVLFIVLIVFGGRKLRTLGKDVGEAYKGFKSAMKNEDVTAEQNDNLHSETKANAQKKEGEQ